MKEFGRSCEKFLREIFKFSGRLSRQKYALLNRKLFCIGVLFLTGTFVLDIFLEYNPGHVLLSSALKAVKIIFWLSIWISLMGMAVRRLHDRGSSGWKIVMPIIISIVTDLIIVWIIYYFVLGRLEGTDGANKYGDKPSDDED